MRQVGIEQGHGALAAAASRSLTECGPSESRCRSTSSLCFFLTLGGRKIALFPHAVPKFESLELFFSGTPYLDLEVDLPSRCATVRAQPQHLSHRPDKGS